MTNRQLYYVSSKRMVMVVCFSLSLTLPGCMSNQEKIDVIKRTNSEAIMPDASDFDVHCYDMDFEIIMYEYSSALDKNSILEKLQESLAAKWTKDRVTSDSLVYSYTKKRTRYEDIINSINTYVSPKGRVLVLYAGIDTPTEAKYFSKRAFPRYEQRAKYLGTALSK